jgi:serine/threonine protein phosphatase PrpC
MDTGALTFRSVGRTHAGVVRPLNEDSLLERSDIGLWAVSDGMGGHTAGDVASALIVESMRRLAPPNGEMSFIKAVYDALDAANRELHRRSASLSPHSTMGATVTVLGTNEGRFFCLWAGDSRLYRFAGGKLAQLTRDHRYIQDLLDAGTLDEETAQLHPLRNVITRAVGIDPDLRLDRCEGTINPGDVFMLATDGVTSVCSNEEIAKMISGKDIDAAADAIVHRCLDRGAPDNLTLILVKGQPA